MRPLNCVAGISRILRLAVHIAFSILRNLTWQICLVTIWAKLFAVWQANLKKSARRRSSKR
jgi:hypothetical protein